MSIYTEDNVPANPPLAKNISYVRCQRNGDSTEYVTASTPGMNRVLYQPQNEDPKVNVIPSTCQTKHTLYQPNGDSLQYQHPIELYQEHPEADNPHREHATILNSSNQPDNILVVGQNPVNHDAVVFANTYRSCCFQIDKRALTFFSQFTVSLAVLLFCGVQLFRSESCERDALYSGMLTLIVGCWLPSPRMRGD